MSEPAPARVRGSRRAEFEVAAAVAREAVISLHVRRALELVQLGAGSVDGLRMVEIYSRLLSLSGTTRETVVNRVLASFGAADVAIAEPGAHDDEPGVWQILRRRLRGRVHTDLRFAVELHTGVTHRMLLDVHVSHAYSFALLFADRQRLAEACALYADMTAVPPTVRPLLYPLMLARIADSTPAPVLAAVPAAAAEPAAVAAPAAAPEPVAAALDPVQAALRARRGWSGAPGLAR